MNDCSKKSDDQMKKFYNLNKALWNEYTPIHEKSKFYDVESFKKGRCSLSSIEVEELGDISGKTLLHLQCHFGLDSLSWARRGACVTGVDFSDKAIELAKRLAKETGIQVRFILSNLYDLQKRLRGRFDIVYTSYGVLCWLPDLPRWASVISHFLKPGGVFYIVESHPLLNMYDYDRTQNDIVLRMPYFFSGEPIKWESEGSYADKNAVVLNASFEWTHPLSEIVMALIDAGLQVEFLHEFPFICWEAFPILTKRSDGYWAMPSGRSAMPLMFSLKAFKPS